MTSRSHDAEYESHLRSAIRDELAADRMRHNDWQRSAAALIFVGPFALAAAAFAFIAAVLFGIGTRGLWAGRRWRRWPRRSS
jgi:hypothetical protein